MPQFDLKGRGDYQGAISKGVADLAAKNPNGRKPAGTKTATKTTVTKSDSSEKKMPAVPGTLSFFMKKTGADGKGNAKNRAYTLYKRYKQTQRRGA